MTSANKTSTAAIAAVAIGLFLVLALGGLAVGLFGIRSSMAYRSGPALAPVAIEFTGRVLLPDGTPCEYADVRMQWSGPSGSSSASFSSGPDGRFSRPAVPGRTYVVEVLTIGRDRRPVEFTPVEITPPAHGVDLVVKPR